MSEKTNLDEALASLLDERPGRSISVRCFTGQALEDLPESTRDLFQRVIDSDIPAVRVAEVLAEQGIDLAPTGISRHRRRGKPGGCRCPKETA